MILPPSKVLVLDDSEIVRELVRRVLEPLGVVVILVDSPFGFSNALNRERPDLALVDISMPALRGDKLVEIAVRNRRPNGCRFILFSDRSESELRTLAAGCGADGYLQKTSDAPALRKAVQRLLGA